MANGVYDGVSTDFNGDAVKAPTYYSKLESLMTVAWHLDAFVGIIELQATLDDDMDGEYFSVAHLAGDGLLPTDESGSENFTGRYTWIRARVTEFTAGAITKVQASY